MNSGNITDILTILSTMQGYPSFPPLQPGTAAGPAPKMDPLRMTYAALLSRIPDALAKPIRNNVLLRFDQRPSVKNLADWAASLGPQAAFDIKQLDGSKQPDYRPGGMNAPGSLVLAAAQRAGRSAVADKMPIPESAKAVFRQLQARHKAEQHRSHTPPSAPSGEWGLEYLYPDGKTERFPARHSEEEARRRRDAVCRKYSHFTCRVYSKG